MIFLTETSSLLFSLGRGLCGRLLLHQNTITGKSAGPNMAAIIFIEDENACIERNDWDLHIYFRSLSKKPLNRLAMLDAISVSKGSKYPCNPKSKMDYICLRSRKWSKSHMTMVSGRTPWKPIFDHCNHIWSVLKHIAII